MIDKLEEVLDIKIYGLKDSKKRVLVIVLNIGDMDFGEVIFLLDSDYNIVIRLGIYCLLLVYIILGILK